jgi:hypothetical protein
LTRYVYISVYIKDGKDVYVVQVGVPSVGRVRLDHDPDAALARLDLLRELGFKGSYTIEFTLGVKQGGVAEDLEETFRNAVADMRFLRAHL